VAVESDDVISLQDYLVVLRRQRWIVLLVTVLVVVAALAFSLAQTPIYQSNTDVLVEPIRRSQDVGLGDDPWMGVDLATEQELIRSRPVAERAAEILEVDDVGALRGRVSTQGVSEAPVVRISASSTDPAEAADIAEAFAQGYMAHRRAQALDGLLAAREDLEQRSESLRQQVADLDEEAEDNEAAALERETLVVELAQLRTQARELGDAADGLAGGGSVLAPAEVPTSPVSPQPVRTGALALVLGLLLGVGLAFLRDHLDDVIRDEDDFKRATGKLPVLGRIPSWEDPEGGVRLATVVEPHATASEAYRELSAGVRFLLVAQDRERGPEPRDSEISGRGGKSILVASAAAGDGKTSTAANLAVAAARVGLRTVLVDTDLRRPTVADRFGLGKTTGLSDVLLSGDPARDHVLDVGVENLLVLPAGTIPPNPHELLASPAMRTLGLALLEQADLVVYDTPAVLGVPDALELGRHVDLAILVGRARVTSRRQLSSAIERLEQVGTNVAGTVFNGIDPRSEGYYYSYYYVEQPAETDEVVPRSQPEPPADRPRRLGRRAGKATTDEPTSGPPPEAEPGPPAGAPGFDPSAPHEAQEGRYGVRTIRSSHPPEEGGEDDPPPLFGDR
jgi:polysaccharide biosynthesis transport protein